MEDHNARKEFSELSRYTLVGYVAGLLTGGLLDHLGFQRSGLGQALVRTLAGEGESVLEGVFALRQRLARSASSLAEAYGAGKFFGMAFPWIVDAVSRWAGVPVYGVGGFYIPYFYAMSDQIGASVSGLLFFRRQSGSWRSAFVAYLHHPVMITGLTLILTVPGGLALARLLGFSPTTQVRAAIETILANLCWLPPLVGWWHESRATAGRQGAPNGA